MAANVIPPPLNDRGAVHRFRFERVRKIPLAPILLLSSPLETEEINLRRRGILHKQTMVGKRREEEDRRHKSLGGVAARGGMRHRTPFEWNRDAALHEAEIRCTRERAADVNCDKR